MTTDAILAELRTLPGAPESLRGRVRALPEPQPRFSWALPRIELRRTLLVLAPAVLALAVGAAALHGLVSGGTSRPVAQPTLATPYEEQGARAADGSAHGSGGSSTLAPAPRTQALTQGKAAPLPPSSTRL